jgi:lysozyme
MFTRHQKKFIVRVFYLVVALTILSFAFSFFLHRHKYRKARFTRYPEFGINMPESYSIHGIDVSKYQDIVAWEEVQAMKVKAISLGFAYIKATEGIANTDPQFKRNWNKSKDAGMFRGAYHFFIGSKDGKMQAENYISSVSLEPGDLPPVLDIEQLNGATPDDIRREAHKWLSTVEDYYHVQPVIYTNVDFYNRCLGTEFDNYPLWVAHYYQENQPRIKRGWTLWQHSDEGHVNGIIPPVDFNVFNGDSLAFQSFLLK